MRSFWFVIAEMVKSEPPVIAHPVSISIGNDAAMKIPVGDVIGSIMDDRYVLKQH
jgi:hypothetical protein